MKLCIVAVGLRMPTWAELAWDDYHKRFPPDWRVDLKAVKAEPRSGRSSAAILAAERARIQAAIPRGAHVVALDERGSSASTAGLAAHVQRWQNLAQEVALLIGGPDGLDANLRQAAHERLRLSDMTLPHALVRVLLIEQLYRAWSIHAGHPYHRE